MKFLDSIVITRPEDCDKCPFSYFDADWGEKCRYAGMMQDESTGWMTISTPEEALKYGKDCAFIIKPEVI